MANCYRCGRPIEDPRYHLRRRVKTGGYERRRYGRGRVDTIQAHYGFRIVCPQCARSLDFQNHRLELIGHLQVILALVILVAVLLASR